MLEILGVIAALLGLLFYGLYRLYNKYPSEATARLRSAGFPDVNTDAKAHTYSRLYKLCAALSVALFVAEYISSKW